MWCVELKVGMGGKNHRYSKHTKFRQIWGGSLQFFSDWAWNDPGLISYCSMLLCPKMCLFANHSSFNACIMVLPKLTFVFLCSPFFSLLLHRWRFAVDTVWLLFETQASRGSFYAILCLECYANEALWCIAIERQLKYYHTYVHGAPPINYLANM